MKAHLALTISLVLALISLLPGGAERLAANHNSTLLRGRR